MVILNDDDKEPMANLADEPQFSQQAREAFMRHARKDGQAGEYYLTSQGFIDAIAPASEDYHKIKRSQYIILFRIADRQRKGKVDLQDWITFENLLVKPDAEYEIAFRFFDINGTGSVKFEDFVGIYNEAKGDGSLPFNWNSGWASLYVGGSKHRHEITYPQFSQMLRGLLGEKIRQAFQYFDKDGDGYIEPKDFERIIRDTVGHKLSDHLLDHLPSLCNVSTGTKISYAIVRAFQNIIRDMDLVEMIVRKASSRSSDGKITKTDFLNEASRTTRFATFTPMEADVLFHFATIDEPSGKLGLRDFAKVIDPSWRNRYPPESKLKASKERINDTAATSTSIFHDIIESAHHFALGSLAGAFGAFMVYPIDLVKTRMQNQRNERVGQVLYKNSLDCASKVIRNEGIRGLYSGVLPQLIGVAPEKAIKLTVNDLVRGKFTDKKSGAIWWPWEILAGGSAGACQVIFTNPLEIVKIRLQVQGEVSKSIEGAPKRSAMWIVRNLGLVGLYKGASACLLRDVPFSAIYFPTYSHLKRDYFGEGPQKKLGIFQLLAAGAIAGIPAAYLTTPCDVIKTRLQVEARKGETQYRTLRHCAQTILQQEGFKAFFKGGPARILRSSPQFGFTLAGYELLQTLLPMPGSMDAKDPGTQQQQVGLTRSESKSSLPYLRSRNALKILLDLDQNFGKFRLSDDAGKVLIPSSAMRQVASP